MPIKLFIAGTDTNVGKTYISAGILNSFNRLGKSTLGIKPVASGCNEIDGIIYNDDALTLQAASSVKLDYKKINPFAFLPPISPHIAAQQLQRPLNINVLTKQMQFALEYPVDVCVIEGVGGWHAPLNDTETMADFVKINNFNVILVVGMRLGCLNHAILTVRAIKSDNIPIAGWIANCIDPAMQCLDENILTLRKWFEAPCLGIVKHMGKPEDSIDVSKL